MKNKKSFAKDFLYNMHQLYMLVEKHMEKKLQNAKTISFSQFWVLVCFIDCKDKSKQVASEIAKLMYITEATLSRHISRLAKDKLIIKEKDSQNGRKYIINLTAKGKKEYIKAKGIIEKELDNIFNIVKISERQTVISNFDKILIKLKDNK